MSSKVENVDIAFQMITEAADEFQGFIMGLPEGDTVQRLQLDFDIPEDLSDKEANAEKRKIRSFFSSICDRTNGGYALSQISSEMGFLAKINGVDPEYIISTVHTQQPSSISENLAKSGASEVDFYYDMFIAEPEMQAVVAYMDPRLVANRTVSPETIPTGANGEQLEDTRTVDVQNFSSHPALFEVPLAYEDFNFNKLIAVEPNASEGIDRIENPSMGAVIIKDPVFGFNSRNANHMPVFLSAVSPLEMSRCTPVLDVKILTKRRGGSLKNKLGIYNFLRYEMDYEKSPSEGGAVFNASRPAASELDDTLDDFNFNYMDLFTSPQTMVNPNINRAENNILFGGGSDKNIFGRALEKKGNFEFNNVRDPFQPLMTLLSFNPMITGIGHGLLATKKASLKIKLHDKSRIKDLSALLSPNEFSQTKFIIEFGWSHPDGYVDSDNTLGKYLNALRDLSVYQLVNADYSFGNDNSVDITLNLVCSGFQQMKSVSAAGGIYTNLNTIVDEVEQDVTELFNDETLYGAEFSDLSKTEKAKKVKEIRGQLKVSKSDLSKKSTVIPFTRLKSWKSVFETEVKKDNIVEGLLSLLYGEENLPDLSEALRSGDEQNFSLLRSYIDEQNVNAGDIIYAKLESLPFGIDPFRAQVVKAFAEGYEIIEKNLKVHDIPLIGVEDSNPDPEEPGRGSRYPEAAKSDHVSLGKIISMFIGYPMSTVGIYDEVQLFFYPVNEHAAAARKHTTASFPINMKDLREEIDRRIKSSEQSFRNLSVHGFFAILERIVSNQTITAYDLFPEFQEPKKTQDKLDEFQKLDFDKKYAEASAAESGVDVDIIEARIEEEASGAGADQASIQQQQKGAVIDAYITLLSNSIRSARESRLREVYESEEEYFQNYFVDKTKFAPVNLSMYFETFSPRSNNDPISDGAAQDFIDFFKNQAKRRSIVENGKALGKTILRIHIYDENSNMGPDVALYGTDFTNMSKTSLAKEYDLSSYSEIKGLLMKRHPTIIHGASSGVVNSLSVSSNTSGQLSNILMVESYGQSINAGSDTEQEPEGFDEVVLLPTTVNLEMMGFPMLARGQQIFIDFGTQTSLDNLYTVKSVNHDVQPGSFKTSSILVPANQMIVSSFRNRLESLIKIVDSGGDES